jgi:hypothetical protein
MKAKIQGIKVEGTPHEIAMLKSIFDQSPNQASPTTPPSYVPFWEVNKVTCDSGSSITINTCVTSLPSIDKDLIVKALSDRIKNHSTLSW